MSLLEQKVGRVKTHQKNHANGAEAEATPVKKQKTHTNPDSYLVAIARLSAYLINVLIIVLDLRSTGIFVRNVKSEYR